MKGENMTDLPARLEYLTRLNGFIEVITEQAKEDHLNENEFLSLLVCKCKGMKRELRENKSISV